MERRLAAIMAADAVGYSRMMREDEAGALALLHKHRAEVIDPGIAKHRGRIVKLMGDGLLAEFSSVVEAVDCAAEISAPWRRVMAALRASARWHFASACISATSLSKAMIYMVMASISRPGSKELPSTAASAFRVKPMIRFRRSWPSAIAAWAKNLKNIPDPIEAFAIQGDGLAIADERQEIRYCRTGDGVRLAYAISGQGQPLVKTGNWLNHLEYDWESPIWRYLFVGLSRDHRLIRYDPRGTGLSDWDVDEVSQDAWVNDLATVVHAAGVERFPLLAVSQGCAISIAYAVKYPARVSHLILYGGFALGASKRTPADRERRKALATLMRMEWGADDPAIRQMFANYLMPGATKEQIESFNDLQRKTTSAECAARYFEATGNIDVVELLPQVRVPTLVMHARGDLQVPFELGRQLAAGIPGAKFVAMQSNNHILLEQDPATQRCFEEMRLFLNSR